ncbi:MAG TPA: ribosome-associated translation inhibitor RaiA [Xanthobacteraceae bacterium]|nr:ribosome-associated translation inhibitor RaiA [Xanthobacteraceae bacterium]
MPFRVSGKNLDIGEALRERIASRVRDALQKYYHGASTGHVTVARDGFGFRTECTLHLSSGTTLQTEAMAADAYASADLAALRLEKRLRRYKRRLADRHSGRGNGAADRAPLEATTYVISAPEPDSDEDVTDFKPAVIAESVTALRDLSVSEAVLELDLTGAPVLAFRRAGYGRINFVYRRSDGHVGWIDPAIPPGDNDH